MPDLHHRPREGFVTQLHLSSPQVHGYFPECGLQRDGGIEPYPACGARQKEPLPIGVLRKLTQRLFGRSARPEIGLQGHCGPGDDIPSLAIAKIER